MSLYRRTCICLEGFVLVKESFEEGTVNSYMVGVVHFQLDTVEVGMTLLNGFWSHCSCISNVRFTVAFSFCIEPVCLGQVTSCFGYVKLYLSIQGCYGIVFVVSIESLMFLYCFLCSDSVKGCYCRVILYMYGLERSTLSCGCYWLGYFVLTEDTLSIESK